MSDIKEVCKESVSEAKSKLQPKWLTKSIWKPASLFPSKGYIYLPFMSPSPVIKATLTESLNILFLTPVPAQASLRTCVGVTPPPRLAGNSGFNHRNYEMSSFPGLNSLQLFYHKTGSVAMEVLFSQSGSRFPFCCLGSGAYLQLESSYLFSLP